LPGVGALKFDHSSDWSCRGHLTGVVNVGLVGTCLGRRGSFWEKATWASAQACVARALHSVEVVRVAELAVVEEVLSLPPSGHRYLLGEAAVARAESQQCFASSQQPGPEEPGHVEEARLEGPQHPIVVQAGLPRHSGTLAGGRLGA
jgi:hypothetical protein